LDDKVVDSRISKEGGAIRRRRECLSCGNRFTTRESVVGAEMVVVKHDDTREDFDPEKLRRGMELACWKRSVRDEQIDGLIADIVTGLSKRFEREVPSHVIGELAMTGLRRIDEVAYVRFASVYRRFTAADEFINEVQSLSGTQEDAGEQEQNEGP